MNTFTYVKQTYGVPAECGRRVVVDGKPGIIVQDRGHHIGVNFDSDKPGVIKPIHPTWKVEYLGMGEIRQLTRSQRIYREFQDSDCGWTFIEYLRWRHANRHRIAAIS